MVLGALAAMVAVGCNRWHPNEVQRLHFRDPDTAFEVAQVTLQHRDYTIEQLDPINYYIRVTAKLDQPGERASHFEIQVYSDGQLRVRAHGFHVRDGNKKAHRKLLAEMEELAAALKAGGGAPQIATR
jgi:hypothetical protein